MQRVIVIGVALGLVAALVSRFSDDNKFCDLAQDDGLVAREADDRFDEAVDTAPDEIANDVTTLRDGAAGTGAPSRAEISRARSDINDWLDANCSSSLL